MLADAYKNEGFLDYGSLVTIAQLESKPSIEALKDLTNRLRDATATGSSVDITPPPSCSDGPASRSQSRSRVLREVREPIRLLTSRRYNPHGSSTTSRNSQAPSEGSFVSFVSSENVSSTYESDSYRDDLDQLENPRFRDHDSMSSYSHGSSSRNAQPSWNNLGKYPNSATHLPSPLFSKTSRIQNDSPRSRMVSPVREQSHNVKTGSMNLFSDQSYANTFDSRNNSTSDDGRHPSQFYGSSWKSSTIATPETLPSPTSPGPPPYYHDDVVYLSNVGKVQETSAKPRLRQTKQGHTRQYESVEAPSPHSQSRGKPLSQFVENFGPPPAPPPICKLPEPPRFIKVSGSPTPTRRELDRDITSTSSYGVSTFEDYGMDPYSPIPVISNGSTFREQPKSSKLPACGIPFNTSGPYGLNHAAVRSSVPQKLPMERFDGSRAIPSYSLPPTQQEPNTYLLSPTIKSAITQEINSRFFGDEETLAVLPVIKQIAPSKESSASVYSGFSGQTSRLSLLTITSGDGTSSHEKWICLTKTVKQIPGFAGPPIDFIGSTSHGMQSVDNIPNDSNKYWTLCKNAVIMQTGEGKKSAEEVANRPAGITGNEKYIKCRKCKYECSAYAKTPSGKGATTDPRWKQGPNGLMYKDTILFKSHVTTKKDKLPQEEYHFGCILCAYSGNGMPIFKGKESLLTHLATHGNGNYPDNALKARINFTTRREYEAGARNEHFELVLP